MKLHYSILLLFFINYCNAQNVVLNDSSFAKRIECLKNEDQKWRNLFTDYKNGVLKDTLNLDFIQSMINKTDSLNYYELENIINSIGFPAYSKVGRVAAHSFWLLVQHQDNNISFQEKVLEMMYDAYRKNDASGKDFAYLKDRVQINKNEKQIYGTQLILNKSQSSYEPNNLIDPGKVNERRSSVGLGPIEHYIDTMNSRYFGTLKK